MLTRLRNVQAAAVPQTPSIPALATKLDALDLANAGSPSLLATAATAPSHFGVIRTQKARSAGNAVATLLDSDHHRPTQRKRVSTLKTSVLLHTHLPSKNLADSLKLWLASSIGKRPQAPSSNLPPDSSLRLFLPQMPPHKLELP